MSTMIRLTPTHMINIGQNRRTGAGEVGMAKLPREVYFLFPLDQVLIFQAGESPCAEVAFVNNLAMSWRCAELFGDVMTALRCNDGTDPLIMVPRSDKIVEATAQSFPMPQKAEAYMRGAEPGRTLTEQLEAIQEAEAVEDAPRGPTWDDITPPDAPEPVEAEARKYAKGDIRIAGSGEEWVVQVIDHVGDALDWVVPAPRELQRVFKSFAEAAQAVRIAGYARRLVVD